ncbi:AAA family ATPase [Desulfogranum marinum]|uniref:AAA family ATPase n=1 Tax=Desulfogranum marinum TaxID=453220 RepID=UPI001965AFB3|nr:AAA family ATPase [Desulfogranum marinum]MBM9513640.1 AAA family ATPase [Desulfogranum marinum]
MRILKIHLRNLNSLTGTWSINFTVPEYTADGIFAITGPTGAGKTTLLDAITLALFGCTPRLGRITKANNEIMSRATGECYAEVEFSTTAGTFRCHWSQHRSRRSSTGELQQHKHEIVDAETGKVLETKVRDVGLLVEKLTGLDYEQFTRSILLAQGQFAAFLNADASQRAPILEQITGTEIYSRISIKVHERTAEERKKTDLIRAETGMITVLSTEEENELNQALNATVSSAEKLQTDLRRVTSSIQLLQATELAEEALLVARNKMMEWHKRMQMATPELQRLERGQQAQQVESDVKTLQKLQQKILAEQAALKKCGQALRDKIQQRDNIAKTLSTNEQAVTKILSQQEEAAETIKNVRLLDEKISEKDLLLQTQAVEMKTLRQERQQLHTAEQKLTAELAEMTGRQKSADHYLEQQAVDGTLVEHFENIRQQCTELIQLDKKHKQEQKKSIHLAALLKKAKEDLTTVHTRCAKAKQTLDNNQLGLEGYTKKKLHLLAGESLTTLNDKMEEIVFQEQMLKELQRLLPQKTMLQEGMVKQKEQLTAFEQQTIQLQQALAAKTAKESELSRQLQQLEKKQAQHLLVADLEAERQKLHHGQPCPLCGSVEHPWSVNTPPVEDQKNKLQEARQLLQSTQEAMSADRASLSAINKDIHYTQQALTLANKEYDQANSQIEVLQEKLQLTAKQITTLKQVNDHHQQTTDQLLHLKKRLQQIQKIDESLLRLQAKTDKTSRMYNDARHALQDGEHKVTSAEKDLYQHALMVNEAAQYQTDKLNQLHQQLQPFKVEPCPTNGLPALLATLEHRRNRWKNTVHEHQQLDLAITKHRAEMDKVQASLATLDAGMKKAGVAFDELKEKREKEYAQRVHLFGKKDPDAEEQEWKKKKAKVESEREKSRQLLLEVEKTVSGLTEKQLAVEHSLTTFCAECGQQEQYITQLLTAKGFSSLNEYQEALLPKEELAALSARKMALDKEQSETAHRLREKSLELLQLKKQDPGEKPLETLLEEQTALAEAFEQLQQQIGAVREKLHKNTAAKKALQDRHDALNVQQQEESRWELLHQLVGSADGKKFRVFAQGITFDLLIRHANAHLETMNDRYILLRDPAQPLELQVLDNYQAGEIRSTRNLSGGESFIVSLALSLGLSSMASHNVQIDSLFLDEGFGTLDEEALDTALHTLAGLQREGKLIGVISHVHLLQERISLQITVIPQADGTSLLVGPGCKQVA